MPSSAAAPSLDAEGAANVNPDSPREQQLADFGFFPWAGGRRAGLVPPCRLLAFPSPPG